LERGPRVSVVGSRKATPEGLRRATALAKALVERTMALLTDATVIVEASEKSGTLHQGWEALRLGRLLFLMGNVANDPALSWPKEMIYYGAQVLSRSNLEECCRIFRR
jgi:predicted Rossmann fold nucleotide-binding protein DprA/Smf involved in DNA uptake